MRKDVVFIVAILLCVSMVTAVPTLVSSESELNQCHEQRYASKQFRATKTNINVGVVCARNSRVDLFSCNDLSCRDKNFVNSAYKVNGRLPLFEDFVIDDGYFYQCYSCGEDRCKVTVNRGEKVNVKWPRSHTFFQGTVGKDGVWETTKEDSGIHFQKSWRYDGEFSHETEFCVQVVNDNKPAKVHISKDRFRVNEGDTVSLDALCSDPNNDETTLTYSGWMDSDSKKVDYSDAGLHEVTINCVDSDGMGESRTVTVEVLDKNRAPRIVVK